jgi:hypothetical protein
MSHVSSVEISAPAAVLLAEYSVRSLVQGMCTSWRNPGCAALLPLPHRKMQKQFQKSDILCHTAATMPCRNTATNETAWELPAGAALAGNQPGSTVAAAVATAADAATTQQQQGPSISFEALLQELQEAYDADGSGMGFWEAARARRKVGSWLLPVAWCAREPRTRSRICRTCSC